MQTHIRAISASLLILESRQQQKEKFKDFQQFKANQLRNRTVAEAVEQLLLIVKHGSLEIKSRFIFLQLK